MRLSTAAIRVHSSGTFTDKDYMDLPCARIAAVRELVMKSREKQENPSAKKTQERCGLEIDIDIFHYVP